MSPLIELINQFKSMGVRLQVDGNNIRYFIPKPVKQAHPEIDTLLAELKTHKEEAIKILSQQKKQWVEPKIEFLTDKAVLLWSDMLNDHYWYCVDKDMAIRLRTAGLPVYDSDSVLTMMLISDGGYDFDNVQRVHQGFKKMASKFKNRKVGDNNGQRD